MFKFIKKIFISIITFFGSLSSVNPLEWVSMKTQECKVRPKTVSVLIAMSLYFILTVLK